MSTYYSNGWDSGLQSQAALDADPGSPFPSCMTLAKDSPCPASTASSGKRGEDRIQCRGFRGA